MITTGLPRSAQSLKAAKAQEFISISQQEESAMAFVNEIVSEEDVKKYKLDNLMCQFSPYKWKRGRPPLFSHAWTIDREREVYFFPVKSIEEVGPSGRLEPTPRKVFVLNWRGRHALITLDRTLSGFGNHPDSSVRIVWKLISIDTPHLEGVPSGDFYSLLKDALCTYGYGGAHQQVTNTLVEFEF